ncbi:hypothetical protein TRAPUB_7922 [Trametes pubescens]|uniref:DUF659 domain-containing protein n=1 Tax=Trametes pubescens TaxID=154538 RepID=A0A1M2V214_TRAPU|nr:hypothetical protein TRAPUB_7922 [Trametes pubescens]
MSTRVTKRNRDSSPTPSSTREGSTAADGPVQKKARERSPEPDDGGAEPSSGIDEDDGYDGVEAVAARALLAQDDEAPVTTAARKRAKFLRTWSGKTPEQILDKLSKKWWSKAYAHFRPPVIHGATPGGQVMHRFICKKHPLKHVDRSDYEDSTGNLGRHGTQYSYARVRFYLAMWCARRHRPFTIVEDPELLMLLKMLYGRVELPKRLTVSRDVQFIHTTSKTRLVIMFKGLPCRIHICVDGWTSPNILSFLGITAHWHDSGKIRHVILDFVRLTSSHTGKHLVESVINALREFGIEEKKCTFSCRSSVEN